MRSLLAQIISPAKGHIAGVMALSALVSILSIVQPALMQKLIDDGLLKEDSHTFIVWLSIMMVLGFGSIVLSSFNRIAYTAVSMKILFLFRERVFSQLFHHTKYFFTTYPSGDLLSRIQGDVNEMQQFATDSMFAIFSAFIGLIGVIFVIHNYSIPLTIAVIVLLPFEFMILRPLYKPMENSVRAMRENNSTLGHTILEMIRNVELLQNFGASFVATDKLQGLHERQKVLTLHNIKLQLVFTQLPALVALLGRGGILVYGGILVIEHQMKLGELIAFLTYFGMILGPVQTLLGVLNTYPKAKVSFQRLQEMLPQAKAEEPRFLSTKNGLEVRSLFYAYPQAETNLIENLNFTLKLGESVAIFGRNGAGKSTFADLLCGLEYPNSGEIYVNSTPIHLPGNNASMIAKLEQHPAVLRDTLRTNLVLGKLQASDEELWSILEHVGLTPWAQSLKDGLDTILGEAGSTLSGGERQRIALARLALLNPAVAIFDEFTSSLDYMSVRGFYELIVTLFPVSARIIISHDLDVIKYVDRAYEMREGQLHSMEKNHD
ncbi:MAG: ABC transporter ATP-binding protein [Sulfuricurvum sp.]